jgi:hypothetical protein
MAMLTKSRTGRAMLHIVACLFCVMHGHAPHLLHAFNGIIREIKGI